MTQKRTMENECFVGGEHGLMDVKMVSGNRTYAFFHFNNIVHSLLINTRSSPPGDKLSSLWRLRFFRSFVGQICTVQNWMAKMRDGKWIFWSGENTVVKGNAEIVLIFISLITVGDFKLGRFFFTEFESGQEGYKGKWVRYIYIYCAGKRPPPENGPHLW